MGAPEVSRRPAGLLLGLGAGLVVVVLAAGCGAAGVRPEPTPGPATPTVTPTGPPRPSASPIPPDGVGLVGFGIANGPREFSVPRSAVAESVVDQPNNVVLVLRAPAPDVVSGYLQQTLPGAGFRITDADPGDATFTFDGPGWSGSFTTGDGVSAVLLRPR